MNGNLVRIAIVVLIMASSGAARAADFKLNFERLQPMLRMLGGEDHDIVNDTISLIRRGDHSLALTRLASLQQRHPDNSSLRILASYALLEAGNLIGAFREAEKAHSEPNGDSYKCWFMAKVALLNGKKDVCERELKHLEKARDLKPEVAELKKELAKK